MRPEMNDR